MHEPTEALHGAELLCQLHFKTENLRCKQLIAGGSSSDSLHVTSSAPMVQNYDDGERSYQACVDIVGTAQQRTGKSAAHLQRQKTKLSICRKCLHTVWWAEWPT